VTKNSYWLCQIDRSKLSCIELLRNAITYKVFEHFDGSITMSFGIALWPAHSDFDTALQHADNALYASKQNGRNQVTTASTLHAVSFSG
jgi:GGDEF domain-containing protein